MRCCWMNRPNVCDYCAGCSWHTRIGCELGFTPTQKAKLTRASLHVLYPLGVPEEAGSP